MTGISVAALTQLVGGRLVGDGSRLIVGLGDLRTAGPDRIGFVRDARFAAAAKTTRVGAVLAAEDLGTTAALIVVKDVDVAYAKVANHFHPVPRASEHAVHPSAVVDPEAVLEAPVVVGPRAVVGKAKIGSGTVLSAGVVVGDGAVVGRDCFFHPNCTVYGGVQVGNRVVVHASAVLGSDGFGYANEGGTWIKVPQLGGAVIEDDVEIGAGTTIDRGTLGVTRIGARTKIDNLCHVAHNCTIGKDVAIAAGAGIAGSASIGDRCVFAGNVGVGGHIAIAADVRLGGGTIVLKDLPKSGDYMGHPVLEKRRFLRLLRVLRGLVPKHSEAEE
ncbi:MAG: UDP-3-O-(3-hydroxymyristoyl)glucosamine N-acyltransferase [Planctomycetes bacterium]|nr:UDP-3-O-(3-hydroxymyristoyl)glucosamine N-acyltransferase [Planctomycetota bacterium]